ncbi:MAG: TlpA family protein disulfide reductase [Aquificae bacterium]|nr:TlpA family protein disulfide reductase [Aquificota bacterium]
MKTFTYFAYFLILLLFAPSFAQKKAPYFELFDEDGNTVKSHSLKGQPTVLVFWGINCSSCREDLPKMEILYQKYKEKNIRFFAIVMDSSSIDEIKKRKIQWNFTIPVLIGNKKIMYKYRIIGVPITYILDKDMKIKKVLYGVQPVQKIEKILLQLLKNEKTAKN